MAKAIVLCFKDVDQGAAGDRTFDQTFAVALTGEKDVRIRCKSTVSADDPIYYGASFLAK